MAGWERRISAAVRGLGIKIKWPGTGADGGVLRAWWLAVDAVGKARGAGQFLAHADGQHFHVRYPTGPDSRPPRRAAIRLLSGQ
jgi:hypothetical protein